MGEYGAVAVAVAVAVVCCVFFFAFCFYNIFLPHSSKFNRIITPECARNFCFFLGENSVTFTIVKRGCKKAIK